MSLPTVARELEVALGHPGPDRPRHHWVYRTGEVNDYKEYGKVHDSIIELWEAMQKGEVTDEKSFKGWIGQAKELSQRHASIRRNHEGLQDHDWLVHVQRMLSIETVMLEGTCGVCRRGKPVGDCTPKKPTGMLEKGVKVNCEPCDRRKVTCAWGEKIPFCLHELKLTILTSRSEADSKVSNQGGPGPASTQNASSKLMEKAFLDRLQAVSKAALARTHQDMKDAKDEEAWRLVWCFEELYRGRA